ncbi:hypothetical protein BX666DRAFT_2029970 [Dichotomocladium elegans]|nr:hypothetical protein BX666DRAFT_2029970 [Dichotomocladium elegans]
MPFTKYGRPEKAHPDNKTKVSYEEIAFLLDYLEENQDDLAIWLNKGVNKHDPESAIPQGGSGRFTKASVARKIAARLYDLTDKSRRWEAEKNTGATRVLATWRQLIKEYHAVRKIVCNTGYSLSSDDHARGIKTIEQYKEHYCCFYDRLDAMLAAKEAPQQPAAMNVGVYQGSISVAQRPPSTATIAREASSEDDEAGTSRALSPRSGYDSSFAGHRVSFSDTDEHRQSWRPRSEYDDNRDEEENANAGEEDRSRKPAKRCFTATFNRFTDIRDRRAVNRNAELLRYKKAKLQLLADAHALEQRRIDVEQDLARERIEIAREYLRDRREMEKAQFAVDSLFTAHRQGLLPEDFDIMGHINELLKK